MISDSLVNQVKYFMGSHNHEEWSKKYPKLKRCFSINWHDNFTDLRDHWAKIQKKRREDQAKNLIKTMQPKLLEQVR